MNSILIMKDLISQFLGNGLKPRALRAAAWTSLGYGISQAIRLASNLILTRILFPEAFGLMAIIQVFMQGIAMFSDLGVGASIIQNRRGDEPLFLDTAWTIQVIKGILLFLIMVAISSPVAEVYKAPILTYLMPIAALSAVISGFTPIRYQTANRNLLLGRLTLIEVLSQFVSMLVLVALALWTRSVWSLVFGGLVGSAIKLFLVCKFMDGRRSTFAWDLSSLRDIVHFGKWIFLGSVLGFFANQGDKLILASYMTKAELGIYSIAFGISSIVWALHSKINHHVFFPIYANLRDLTSAELRPRVYKARMVMCVCLVPPLILLVLFGVEVVGFLYDERYEKAGWMIQIISIGYAISVATSIGPFYLAQGNSKLMTTLIAVKSAIFVISMLVGAEYYGVAGVLVGGAISHLILYFIESSVYRHYSLWIWQIDVVFLSIIVCAVSYRFRDLSTVVALLQ